MKELSALTGGAAGVPDLSSAAPGKRPEGPHKGGAGPSFGEVLAQVNRMQLEADAAIRDFATGGRTTLHETMIALEKADLSFRLLMQVRNKIVQAYEQVMRMQV